MSRDSHYMSTLQLPACHNTLLTTSAQLSKLKALFVQTCSVHVCSHFTRQPLCDLDAFQYTSLFPSLLSLPSLLLSLPFHSHCVQWSLSSLHFPTLSSSLPPSSPSHSPHPCQAVSSAVCSFERCGCGTGMLVASTLKKQSITLQLSHDHTHTG